MTTDLSSYDPDQLRRIELKTKRPRSRFLAPGDSLMDIIEADRAALGRLGLTYDQVADCLEGIAGTALYLDETGAGDVDRDSIWSVGIEVSDQFLVGYETWMGCQECPFDSPDGTRCEGSGYADRDFWIENRVAEINPRRIFFPGLMIHLIRDHHFFEGHVEHRLDPQEAAAVLQIEPARSYKPSQRTCVCWLVGGERLEDRQASEFVDDADSTTELDDGLVAYRRAEECVVVSTRGERESKLIKPNPEELFIVGILDPGAFGCQGHATDFAVDEELLALSLRRRLSPNDCWPDP